MAKIANRIKLLTTTKEQDSYQLKGEFVEMDKDGVLVRIGSSLFDIPLDAIKKQGGSKEVGQEIILTIASDAQILQSVVRPVSTIISGIFGNRLPDFLAECKCECECTDCNCDCNCDCECKCDCKCDDAMVDMPSTTKSSFRRRVANITPTKRLLRNNRR